MEPQPLSQVQWGFFSISVSAFEATGCFPCFLQQLPSSVVTVFELMTLGYMANDQMKLYSRRLLSADGHYQRCVSTFIIRRRNISVGLARRPVAEYNMEAAKITGNDWLIEVVAFC